MRHLLSGAVFSEDRRHRYTLTRAVPATNQKKFVVTFLCLNPSTADETLDDPTVTRCVGYAADWGATIFNMLNIFAFRSTNPYNLYHCEDPIGQKNDYWIRRVISDSDVVVAGWGNHGELLGRGKAVSEMFRGKLQCLKINGSGQPCHPLYLSKTRKPFTYN